MTAKPPPTWADMMAAKREREMKNFYIFERGRLRIRYKRARLLAIRQFKFFVGPARQHWRDASNGILADHLKMEYRLAAIMWLIGGFRSAVAAWKSVPKARAPYLDWTAGYPVRHTRQQQTYYAMLERWESLWRTK